MSTGKAPFQVRSLRHSNSLCMYCILFVVCYSCGDLLMADEGDAALRAMLQLSLRANQRIENVSCTSYEYAPMDDPEFPWATETARQAVDKSTEGYALMGEYKILIDRVGRRMRYNGREFVIGADPARTPYYKEFNAAYDGEMYRTYGPTRNTGQQLLYRDELECRRSLHAFLGDNIGGGRVVGADLTYWLGDDEGWSLESQPNDSDPRIARRYRTATFASEMRCHVTLSSAHDYLPCLIETYWCETETMYQQLRVDEFAQVEPNGTWLPVRGWHQSFFREPVFPEGVDQKSYQQMSAERKKQVDPLVRWAARRLTEPRLIVVEPQSIKINQPLDDTDFVLKFPADARVYDEKSDQPLLGGVVPIVKKKAGLSGASFSWIPLVVVNAAFVVITWFIVRRRRRDAHN